MNTPLKMRYHRELPKAYKLHPITLSKSNHQYFVSLNVTYIKQIQKQNIHQVLGIDLNIFKRLQRKQSRRVLKSKKDKIKWGKNFSKTQKKLNNKFKKAKNSKNDWYHKIINQLSNEFDLIAVEALQTKNMTKRAKQKVDSINPF